MWKQATVTFNDSAGDNAGKVETYEGVCIRRLENDIGIVVECSTTC